MGGSRSRCCTVYPNGNGSAPLKPEEERSSSKESGGSAGSKARSKDGKDGNRRLHLWHRGQQIRASSNAPTPSTPTGNKAKRRSTNERGQGSKDKIDQKDDEIMPFRKSKNALTKAGSGGALQRRGSVEAMEKYLTEKAGGSAAEAVTMYNARVDLVVARGPDWNRGDDDGGAGEAGTITSVDKETQVAKVHWHKTGQVLDGYRFGKEKDLAIGDKASSSTARPLSPPMPVMNAPMRRNSQATFADPSQCIIIFDWDDTLFPTTYVRDDLELNWRKQMKDQLLDSREKAEITANLERCSNNVLELMRMASKFGKVVLVTLARSPWVVESCNNFYPAVGRLIKELKVPIVYAQEGQHVDYNKQEMQTNEEIEKFWSRMKGKAIANELRDFYSQYEGQSWKNIISIGDSDFERLGTQYATEDYMKMTGIKGGSDAVEVDNHVYKVRTKTFKMVDQPTIEELTVEVAMLQKWLPLMVNLDSGFDVNLNDVEDPRTLQSIEKTLHGPTRAEGT